LSPGWRGLKAVQPERIFVADGNQYFNRSGPLQLFEALPESFTKGSKNVRYLSRYLSIQRNPEFLPTDHHQDHVSRQLAPRRHQFSNS
jgi:hypothetical protein